MTGPASGDVARARALVMAHGWNATAFQIVNPGFEHWFSRRHEAVAGYVRCHGVRLVAGSPVAPLASLDAVVDEFEADARDEGDVVCYFGAERRLQGVAAARGRYAHVVLGAQPVWAPALWADQVRTHPSQRAQLQRARNKGIRIEEWPAARASGNPALKACLAQWLETRGLPPLHFLVEPETLDRLEERRVFVALREGEAVAFLVASPVPARRGWLVEQIVRGRDAVNGTSDLLVDAAMRALGASGARFVTLGLAPLSCHAPPQPAATPLWLRATLAWVRAHGRRFYNFEGLDGFKSRLGPLRWDPVHAIAPGDQFSPRMLHAVARAFSGGPVLPFLARGAARAVAWEVSGRSRRPAVAQ